MLMQFDEQKDQVTIERILRVVFLDPECPSPVRIKHVTIYLLVQFAPISFSS